ncbi:cyclophilin-like fold protein [Fusobacterium sp.]|uniref:cyclophilin-like fold protein n=1 Tax=Fusobacterium sp. TaxID=68766 RepID=UPI002902F83E|nr:cyclophilin-like fold protein [Fusobacterium sp.]MDU1910707.1 cyclophilin-like fold protein [Fusobacterium sp.]
MSLKIILTGLIILFSIKAYSSERKIKFSFNDKEIIVALEDNRAAESLLKQLPLTLRFEDYSNTEKISYLPEKLDVSQAPDSCTPHTGDLTYYSPWGNLAFFYKDFGYSKGLILLGKIESGMEELKELDKALSVKIERMNK